MSDIDIFILLFTTITTLQRLGPHRS